MENKYTQKGDTAQLLEEELKVSLVDGRLPCAVAGDRLA